MLEEAAGISGLHSRRHEAELRLKGAEQNLERVEDVIAQVGQQLETLKKQSRLAIRYRGLSGEIRKAEAALFHVRWVSARVAEKETEAEQGRLIVQLGDAMHLEKVAQETVEAADQALTPLRDREMAAAAALQRLTIASEQLAEEARRAEARRHELSERLKQVSADVAREQHLLEESEGSLATLSTEKAQLEAEVQGATGRLEAARTEAQAAQAAVGAAEAEARAAADALAQVRARRAQAQRSADDAANRINRLKGQIAEVVRDAAQVKQSLEDDIGVADRRSALEAAQAQAAASELAAVASEDAARTAQAALDAARPALQQIEANLTRLEAEARTLAGVLNRGGPTLWPAIVDSLKVAAGYETALGAALGDDLEASGDAGRANALGGALGR